MSRAGIWLLSWLILSVLPAWAAKRLTIAQLEHLLSAEVAAHKQDSEIATKIAGVVLAERISPATFARLDAQLQKSVLIYQALRLLADQSEFLDLPVDESVADAAPDAAAQARMLQAAQEYVSQTLRRLPDFLATRTITLYDDTPQPVKQGEWPTRAGLHLVGTSSAEISVSREREDQPPTQGSAVWQSKVGLLSGGEFGTTLGMILTDAAKDKITWSHWERTSAQMLAVFQYSVPASTSHFELISSYQRAASVEGVRESTNGRGVAGIGVRPNVSSSNMEVIRSKPGYHGSIWLNPADGTIYRITLEADMSKGLPFRRAAMLVEYGSVEIAGRRFICPVRSLALSEAVATAESFTDNSTTAWLNETVFTNYHRFASSSRVLEEAASTSAPGPGPVAPEQPATNPTQAGPQSTASIAPTQPAIAPAQPAEEKTQASDQPPAPSTPPVEPSVSVDAAASNARASETSPGTGSSSIPPPAPESGASSAPQPSAVSPDETQPRFSIEVNSVLVPVVVVDKQGRSVAGLGKDDFTVEEDGKKRTIVGFTVVKSAQNGSKGLVDGGQSSAAGGGAPDTAAGTNQPAAPATRHVIFLFDDRHITTSDLALVQKAATHLFEKALAPSDEAAVLSFFGINSGLTHDRAALQAAVMKLAVHSTFLHGKEDCPDVDYYSADQIINKHNPTEFQIAVQKARQCSFSQAMVQPSSNTPSGLDNRTPDPFQAAAKAAAAQALAIGEEDARVSLLSVRNVVRVMSKMPGQRTLIFVSPGFLTLSPETMAMKSEIMNIAAGSGVIVNALDARGLYAGNVDASEGGTTSTLGLVSGQIMQDHLASMQANENVMSELAEGTGGRFFHNNNDLQGGMEILTAGPENLYLLEISLSEVKANGAYHRLRVKLDQPGVEITARKGYFAPKVEKGKK